MKSANIYIEVDGTVLLLTGLDPAERRLLARLRRRARTDPDWDRFDNYWTRAVPEFYQARGLPRAAVSQTLGWRLAQDLSNRLGIASGRIRPPDYRDDLEELIHIRYRTPEAFCSATGLSKTTLERALTGRANLALAALTEALERIGYRLTIAPSAGKKRTADDKG